MTEKISDKKHVVRSHGFRYRGQYEEEIKRELETKLPYLVENGGCIPMIDGDLATDISLENFQYYLELKSSYLNRAER